MTVRAYTGDPTKDERYKQAVCSGWVQAWQTALEVEAGLAARTRLDYLRSVAVFVIQHDKQPDEWTHRDLAATLASFPEGSRRKVRAHLNSFMEWLLDEEVIDRNPMRKLRRPRPSAQKVPDIFTDPEITVMCGNPLLALMLNTGLRKGECRRLQRRHINLDVRRTIPASQPDPELARFADDIGIDVSTQPHVVTGAELRVVGGKGGKDRVIPLNMTAQKAVADLDLTERLNPDDYLWSSRPGGGSVIERSRPIGEASFARWWTAALEACDVDYRNPHTTRHTFATRYLRAGGRLETLRMILGHASSRTTVDMYAHLDVSDARIDVLLLDTVQA